MYYSLVAFVLTRHRLRHEASPPMSIRFALLLCILGLAGHEFAKSSPPVRQVTLDLDRPACKIDFTLGAVLHTVHGTFEVEEGMLRLDVTFRQN
jgi:hypothetical protein